MDRIYAKVAAMLEDYPDVLCGFCDTTATSYAGNYSGVLVLAVPHTEFLTIATYDEERYEGLIVAARVTANEISERIAELLTREGSAYAIPPPGQTSEETLIAPLSFKFAAVRAGLGWIGKNGVLVTEKYGPRVRLSAILIDFDFPAGTPVLESVARRSASSADKPARMGLFWVDSGILRPSDLSSLTINCAIGSADSTSRATAGNTPVGTVWFAAPSAYSGR